MNNLQKHFLSYELSKEFKELGFDELCFGSYYLEGEYFQFYLKEQTEPILHNSNKLITKLKGRVTSPLISQALEFLREKHGIHILLIPTITAAWTYHTITVISERDNDVILGIKSVGEVPPYKNVCGVDFSTFEQAQLAGIKHAVELIKIKKRAEHTMKLKDVK